MKQNGYRLPLKITSHILTASIFLAASGVPAFAIKDSDTTYAYYENFDDLTTVPDAWGIFQSDGDATLSISEAGGYDGTKGLAVLPTKSSRGGIVNFTAPESDVVRTEFDIYLNGDPKNDTQLTIVNGNKTLFDISKLGNMGSMNITASGATAQTISADETNSCFSSARADNANKWYRVVIDLNYKNDTASCTFINRSNNAKYTYTSDSFTAVDKPNAIRIRATLDSNNANKNGAIVDNFAVYSPNTSVAKNIIISGDNTAEIPLKKTDINTSTAYTISATDQYGCNMDIAPAIIWSLLNDNDTEYTGNNVSIDKNGVITVKGTATEQTLKIKATLETDSTVYATKSIELVKEVSGTDYVSKQTFETETVSSDWSVYNTDNDAVLSVSDEGYEGKALQIVPTSIDGRGAVINFSNVPDTTTDIRVEGDFYVMNSNPANGAGIQVMSGNTVLSQITKFANKTATIKQSTTDKEIDATNTNGCFSSTSTANAKTWYRIVIDLHYDSTNGNTQSITFINKSNGAVYQTEALPFYKSSDNKPTGVRILGGYRNGADDNGIMVDNFRVYTPAEAEATDIAIAGSDTAIIPYDTDSNITSNYTASVTDQYGYPMDTDTTISWSLLDVNDNAYTGSDISIDQGTGILTVSGTAKEQTVTIKAAANDNIYATKSVILTLEDINTNYVATETFSGESYEPWTNFNSDSDSELSLDNGRLKIVPTSNGRGAKREFKDIIPTGTTDMRIEGEFYFEGASNNNAAFTILSGNTELVKLSGLASSTAVIKQSDSDNDVDISGICGSTDTWYKIIVDLNYNETSGNTQTVTIINLSDNSSWQSDALSLYNDSTGKPNAVRVLGRKGTDANDDTFINSSVLVDNFRIFTVGKAKATNIKLSGDTDITIPYANDTSVNYAYATVITDQRGNKIDTAMAEWILLNSEGNAEYSDNNITLNDHCILTVANGAEPTTVIIKAVSKTNSELYDTITVSIKENIPTVAITSGAETIKIPETNENDTTSTYTAKIAYSSPKEDSEETIENDPIVWSLIDESGDAIINEYISIDSSSGILTVKNGAKETTVYVKAASSLNGDIFDKKEVLLVKEIVVSNIEIKGNDTAYIPVADSSNYTYDAVVTEKDGTVVADTVIWNLEKDGETYTNENISIDTDGKLTITSDAEPIEITIKAVSTIDPSVCNTKTVTIKALPTITISGESSVSIPENDEENTTAKYTAFYSDENETADITWSLDSYTGTNAISINATTGVLTVTDAAEPTEITIKAVSAINPSVCDTKTVKISKQILVSGVEITGYDTVKIPESKSAEYTYAAIVDGAGTVIWSIEGYNGSDISINATTGVLTIASTAEPTEITIKAVSTIDSSVCDTKTVMLTKYNFEITELIINNEQQITDLKIRKFNNFTATPILLVATYSKSGVLQGISSETITDNGMEYFFRNQL